MKFIKNLKTSDKITLYFGIFNFVSLILLLIVINITYFFIWYNEQKEESLYDMTTNYSSLVGNGYRSNKEAFREYILQKDTIIISDSGEEGLTCSPGVSEKLHNDMKLLDTVKDSLFYRDGETIYFIFSRYYEGIGEVKIFFDTTEYIHSQIIIIKVSVSLIFLWFFIYLFGGKIISRYTLKNLKSISKKAQEIHLDKKYKPINIDGAHDDEIKILADTINKAFGRIGKQTASLKQFITDVSHEFKTPLMIINSDIDVYEKKKEKGFLKKDDDSIFLQSIKTKTAKLNKLIETLFLLTRMEENISTLKFTKKDIGILTQRLIKEKFESYSKKPIELSFELVKKHMILIEETSFNIIIENLISNAIKFSNDKIKIEIQVTKNFIEIKDHGIGMTQAETKRVWEKFYRLDTNKEGFGVGLFLVKRIVDIYKWNIQLESKKGVGSSFKIFFNQK